MLCSRSGFGWNAIALLCWEHLGRDRHPKRQQKTIATSIASGAKSSAGPDTKPFSGVSANSARPRLIARYVFKSKAFLH
ncbi:MAG: hypothetical protein AAGD25_34210 [Cyanobacteria bacterium P01_F01_bin.150]